MNPVSSRLLILTVLLSVTLMFSHGGGVLTEYQVVLENHLPEKRSFMYGYKHHVSKDPVIGTISESVGNLTLDVEVEDGKDPLIKITVFWFLTEIEDDHRIRYGDFEYLNKDSLPICRRNEKHCWWHVSEYGAGLHDKHKGSYEITNQWNEGTLIDLGMLQH